MASDIYVSSICIAFGLIGFGVGLYFGYFFCKFEYDNKDEAEDDL